MAIEVERLIATLEANFNKYDRALNKALGNTNSTFTKIERRGKQLESRLATMGGSGRGLLAAFAGAASLRGAQQLVDAATRIDNALKVAGLSGSELSKVYDRLFASAQRNAAPLESLVTLYGRAAIVQKELGVSTEELLGFTDNVALALRVAGTDAQSASGALLQLGQALGSGTVRAEEFNSILEGALPVAQAAAAGLEEAGGSVAKLRQLVIDGKISSEVFFRAFEAGASMLEDKVAGSSLTVSQSFVRLQNILIDTAGELNSSSGATERMSEALQVLGDWIANTDFSPLINGALEFGESLVGVISKIQELAGQAGRAVGADAIGKYLKGSRGEKISQDAIQARFDGAFRTPTQITATKPNSVIKPVSLSDYAAPVGRGSGGGGGGSKRENEFARETAQIKERTAALIAETAAQAGVNPLVEDYGYTLDKARSVQELLNAAQQAGIAITPALRTQIDTLAEGYATASVEAQRLLETQDRARESAQEFADLGKDVMGGFISDLREGKSASEALAGALDKVASKLLDMALDGLFSGGGLGGLGGGLLGGKIIPGILHKGGVAGKDGYGHGRSVSPGVFAGARRYHKGGVAGLQAGEVPAILQRGELVVPRGGGSGSSRGMHVTVGVSADNNGNLMPFVESVSERKAAQVTRQGIGAYDKQLSRSIGGKVANAQARTM
ncbi:MAG: tape measure protein [Sphingomonas sp.]|nr:tape measure protein [Sphingomonas sp.]